MTATAERTTVRDARADDFGVYAELFRELGIDEPPLPYDRYLTEVLPTTLIAEAAGDPVGFAFFRPAEDVVHLSNIVIARAARRSGVGRMLMVEVARRSQRLGCTEMTLNVLPHNGAAIRLYERVGLSTVRMNRHLKMPWDVVDTLPESATPFTSAVRCIEPRDDEALEREHGLARGLFATQRANADRVLQMIRPPGDGSSVGVFDRGFGGMFPFRAKDVAHALSLLRATRPLAPAGATAILLPIEGRPALADALIAAGASQRFETRFMRGSLANITARSVQAAVSARATGAGS